MQSPKWGRCMDVACVRGKRLSRSLCHNKFISVFDSEKHTGTRLNVDTGKYSWTDVLMVNNKLHKGVTGILSTSPELL